MKGALDERIEWDGSFGIGKWWKGWNVYLFSSCDEGLGKIIVLLKQKP